MVFIKKTILFASGISFIGVIVFFGSGLFRSKFELAGSGMEPNYHDKSSCILDRALYKNSDPMREDVILFNGFTSAGTPAQFVKRIIAIPDERIMIANNLVYINNSLLFELYLAPETKTLVSDSAFMTENMK